KVLQTQRRRVLYDPLRLCVSAFSPIFPYRPVYPHVLCALGVFASLRLVLSCQLCTPTFGMTYVCLPAYVQPSYSLPRNFTISSQCPFILCSYGTNHHRNRQSQQTLWEADCRRGRPEPDHSQGRDIRLSRSQRGGQDDNVEDAAWACSPHLR